MNYQQTALVHRMHHSHSNTMITQRDDWATYPMEENTDDRRMQLANARLSLSQPNYPWHIRSCHATTSKRL